MRLAEPGGALPDDVGGDDVGMLELGECVAERLDVRAMQLFDRLRLAQAVQAEEQRFHGPPCEHNGGFPVPARQAASPAVSDPPPASRSSKFGIIREAVGWANRAGLPQRLPAAFAL
jgi:hypothetical protein